MPFVDLANYPNYQTLLGILGLAYEEGDIILCDPDSLCKYSMSITRTHTGVPMPLAGIVRSLLHYFNQRNTPVPTPVVFSQAISYVESLTSSRP
jgi:hypothetical protein